MDSPQVWCEVDKQQAVILVLLDFSAAFDTVDHDILLQRLHEDIGVCGVPLQWFESYLTGRKQAITTSKTSSSECGLIYGVPQGSVLGPILFTNFTCYTKPLGAIGLSLHVIHADDTQLYIAFKPVGGGELATERVEACVNEMSSWMCKNKLNDSKTEAIIICSVHNHSKVNIPHIQVGDSDIQPVSVVRNIGAQLDETLSMRTHVNSLCSRAHFYLRNISKIRHLLDRRTTSNACSCLCNIAAGQWECLALWTSSNYAIQGATSPERSCSPCVSDGPTGAHNSSTERTTLAACPSVDFMQSASADLSSTAWDCTSVHDQATFMGPANKITTLLSPVTHCCSLPHKVASPVLGTDHFSMQPLDCGMDFRLSFVVRTI